MHHVGSCDMVATTTATTNKKVLYCPISLASAILQLLIRPRNNISLHHLEILNAGIQDEREKINCLRVIEYELIYEGYIRQY